MAFRLEFRTESATFDDDLGPEEVAQILRDLAGRIANEGTRSGPIHDLNGNEVGDFSLVLACEKLAEPKKLRPEDYEYIDGDNCIYRRRKGTGVAVDDIYRPDLQRWVPYPGDAFRAGMWNSTMKKIPPEAYHDDPAPEG